MIRFRVASVDRTLAALREAITASGKTACVIAAGELARLGMRYGDKAPPTDFSFHRTMQYDLEMLKYVGDSSRKSLSAISKKKRTRGAFPDFRPSIACCG